MPRPLKVYRTPIGFHDAYVAAPSQKAALAAWGTDTNLFARGAAEIVSDPELTSEPLARPGEIIKRLRGTDAEHLAALPADEPHRPAGGKRSTPAKPKAKKPRPSRRPIAEAEEALADARRRFVAAREDLDARERALAEERRRLRQREADEIAALQTALDEAEQSYRLAIAAWEK